MLGLLWFLAVIGIITWLIKQPQVEVMAPLGTVTYTECAVPVIRPDFELPPKYQQINFANLTASQKVEVINKNI